MNQHTYTQTRSASTDDAGNELEFTQRDKRAAVFMLILVAITTTAFSFGDRLPVVAQVAILITSLCTLCGLFMWVEDANH